MKREENQTAEPMDIQNIAKDVKTIKTMKSAGVTALAFQARRQIVLEKEAVIAYANRHGLALVGVATDLPPAPTRPTVR